MRDYDEKQKLSETIANTKKVQDAAKQTSKELKGEAETVTP